MQDSTWQSTEQFELDISATKVFFNCRRFYCWKSLLDWKIQFTLFCWRPWWNTLWRISLTKFRETSLGEHSCPMIVCVQSIHNKYIVIHSLCTAWLMVDSTHCEMLSMQQHPFGPALTSSWLLCYLCLKPPGDWGGQRPLDSKWQLMEVVEAVIDPPHKHLQGLVQVLDRQRLQSTKLLSREPGPQGTTICQQLFQINTTLCRFRELPQLTILRFDVADCCLMSICSNSAISHYYTIN